MNTISYDDFKTNRDMCNKDVLRYVENFCSYLSHIENYLHQDFNIEEIKRARFLMVRIEYFLLGAPTTDKYRAIVARYSRCLSRLKKMSFNLNKIKNETE